MQLIQGIDIPVHHQGIPAFISANLGIRQRHVSAVLTLPHFLRTVIKVSAESGASFSRIYPPLPGRQDILDIDVGPFLIPADFAAGVILHPFAYAEIGIEDSAVNHRSLSREIRHTGPAACIIHFHVRTRIASLIPCIGGITFYTGEEHPFSLCNHPLVICILELAAVQPPLIMVGRSKQRHAGHQILCSVFTGIQLFNIFCSTVAALIPPLIIFHPIEGLPVWINIIVIHPLQLGIKASRPPIIDKYRILNLLRYTVTIYVIPQPLGFGSIHGTIGIIILSIESGFRQTSQEFLLPVTVLRINSLLRIKEIPVIAKVFRHLD